MVGFRGQLLSHNFVKLFICSRFDTRRIIVRFAINESINVAP